MTETKERCGDCGLPYGTPEWIEVIVPTHFWREISPSGDEGGLLCFHCMRKRFAALGYGKTKAPVPFRVYYHGLEGRSMTSELYPDFDGDTPTAAAERRRWDALSPKQARKVVIR